MINIKQIIQEEIGSFDWADDVQPSIGVGMCVQFVRDGIPLTIVKISDGRAYMTTTKGDRLSMGVNGKHSMTSNLSDGTMTICR